jgi:hypothetical protein
MGNSAAPQRQDRDVMNLLLAWKMYLRAHYGIPAPPHAS